MLILGAASGNAQGTCWPLGLGLTPPSALLPQAGHSSPSDSSAVRVLLHSPGPRSSSPRFRYQQVFQSWVSFWRVWGGTCFLERDGSLRPLVLPYSSALGCVPTLWHRGFIPSCLFHSNLDLEEDSEVFKMLQENRQGRAAPRQSSSFRLLQEALEAEERGEASRLRDEVRPKQTKEVV